MNCDGVRGLLSAYVDGELSPGELLRVERHLRRCHTCADDVDSLRQTIALVASLEEVEVPDAFRVGLRKRLAALGPVAAVPTQLVPATNRWQRKLVKWALPAAAAAAALAIGLTNLPLSAEPPGLQGGSQIVLDTPVPSVSPSPEPATPNTANPPITANSPITSDSPITIETANTPITSTDVAENAGETPALPVPGSEQPTVRSNSSESTDPPTQPPQPIQSVNSSEPGSATVASVTAPLPEKSETLEPRLSLSVTVTVPTDGLGAANSTLVTRNPSVAGQDNSFSYAVSASALAAEKSFLTELFGSDITFSEQRIDLAAQIKEAELLLQEREAALANLERKAKLMTNSVEKEIAAQERAEYAVRVEQARESLQRLVDRVETVMVTVQVAIPSQ